MGGPAAPPVASSQPTSSVKSNQGLFKRMNSGGKVEPEHLNVENTSFNENNYYDCFGEWWEQRINLISRSEETSGREESDLSGSWSCECDRAEAASSTLPPSDGQSFPDKSNFQNGELTREVFSCRPTYLVELKEEQELNHQNGTSPSMEMFTVHGQLIEKFCTKKSTKLMDALDTWFTRSLTLVTVLGIIFLFWVQNSEYHIGVKSQPKLVWKEKL